MITEFDVSSSTFKIEIVGLIYKYPKMKNSSLFFYFLKKHVKVIKEICKENANEFK